MWIQSNHRNSKLNIFSCFEDILVHVCLKLRNQKYYNEFNYGNQRMVQAFLPRQEVQPGLLRLPWVGGKTCLLVAGPHIKANLNEEVARCNKRVDDFLRYFCVDCQNILIYCFLMVLTTILPYNLIFYHSLHSCSPRVTRSVDHLHSFSQYL